MHVLSLAIFHSHQRLCARNTRGAFFCRGGRERRYEMGGGICLSHPDAVVARGPVRVDSTWRVGLVESCTRTYAGCRRNGESAVRKGQRRAGQCTARAVIGKELSRQDCGAIKHVFSRMCASTKTGTSHGATTQWRTWVHESYGFTHTTTYNI